MDIFHSFFHKDIFHRFFSQLWNFQFLLKIIQFHLIFNKKSYFDLEKYFWAQNANCKKFPLWKKTVKNVHCEKNRWKMSLWKMSVKNLVNFVLVPVFVIQKLWTVFAYAKFLKIYRPVYDFFINKIYVIVSKFYFHNSHFSRAKINKAL